VSFYVVHQTIPPNTPRSAPVIVPFEVANPILSYKTAAFPKNCSMLCGIQICDRSGIVWPSPGSPSQWITGDNEIVIDLTPTILSGSPYNLMARIYNEDSMYERTPEIRLVTEDAK
jgi:hypothetical protein